MDTSKYDSSMPMKEKILYVLSTIEKGSTSEIAAEIIELDGICTEDGVAEITVEIETEINKLWQENVINKLKEHRQKVRYAVNTNP
jgi:hypothetical protein